MMASTTTAGRTRGRRKGDKSRLNQSEATMNKDQVKGSIKDAAGKIQRKGGEVTGSTGQQIKGAVKQVEGKVQTAVGNARENSEKR